MTAQISDTLLVDGYRRGIMGEPLRSWLARKKNKQLRFSPLHTACWRGYVAGWQIFRGRLFLTSFKAKLRDGTPVGIAELFANSSAAFLESVKAYHPDNEGPGQFAFWVDEWLSCPLGELLHYERSGYESIYERALLLRVTDGFVVGQQIIDNEPSPPGAAQEQIDVRPGTEA